MNFQKENKQILITKALTKILDSLIDVMCPKSCIVCGCLLNIGTQICFCDDCKSVIKKHGNVVGNNDMPYEEVISALIYQGGIRDAMIRFKFNGMRYLHHTFSWAIWQKIRDRAFMEEIDVICPVPIHPMREREYNQSMLIAAGIAAYSGKNAVGDMLLKMKNIKPLSSMSYTNRRISIRDSIDFNIKYDIFRKNVLLVDDIFTSGATAAECSRILKMYGASKVYAVSACYALYGEIPEETQDDNEGGTDHAYANLFAD